MEKMDEEASFSISRCYNMHMHWPGGEGLRAIRGLGLDRLHQFVYSIFRVRQTRWHNVADLETALVCIALKMGYKPETGLLFDN